MRDIKFRAWDGKKMLEPEDLTTAPKYRKWLGKKDVVFMQFTGLLDKNGKEIYEGDLFGEMGGDKERPDEFEVFGEVYYDIDFAGFNVKYPNGGWSTLGEHLMVTGNHREVIGNIYENPELLKV